MVWNSTYECMDRDELERLKLDRLQRTVNHVYQNVPFYRARMQRAGARLRAGILAQAAHHGIEIDYTGPDVMPYLTFAGDVEHRRMIRFAEAALRAGVYLHPRHNWFMSAAMDDEVIDRVLRGTEIAFDEVAKHALR